MFRNYNQVLEYMGKEKDENLTQENIITYIQETNPELKGNGITKRTLETVFSDANAELNSKLSK